MVTESHSSARRNNSRDQHWIVRMQVPDAAIVAPALLANTDASIGTDHQWRNRLLGVPYHHMSDILGLAEISRSHHGENGS